MRRSVVIDTDPGIDDAVAILLALASPEFDIAGITTVAGFLCLLTHVVVPAAQLGVLASVGLGFVMIAAVSLAPALMAKLPRAKPRPVPVSARSLDAVRASLLRVTQDVSGTAYRALNSSELGFALAAKTGSADLFGRAARDEDGRVRKHAWVAAYAPPEDPAFALVVFVHDTTATSSHGAVYVAREFLDQPEVRAFLAAAGVAEGER